MLASVPKDDYERIEENEKSAALAAAIWRCCIGFPSSSNAFVVK